MPLSILCFLRRPLFETVWKVTGSLKAELGGHMSSSEVYPLNVTLYSSEWNCLLSLTSKTFSTSSYSSSVFVSPVLASCLFLSVAVCQCCPQIMKMCHPHSSPFQFQKALYLGESTCSIESCYEHHIYLHLLQCMVDLSLTLYFSNFHLSVVSLL